MEEFNQENKEFLLRQKDEYLQSIESAKFIQNILENVFCNSCNIFLSLACLDFGLGVIASCLAGFGVGSFSGFKDLYESNTLSDKQVDGKLIRGVLKIIFALFISYQSVGEMAAIEKMASQASEFYLKDVAKYETVQEESKAPPIKFLILFGGGLLAAGLFASNFSGGRRRR